MRPFPMFVHKQPNSIRRIVPSRLPAVKRDCMHVDD